MLVDQSSSAMFMANLLVLLTQYVFYFQPGVDRAGLLQSSRQGVHWLFGCLGGSGMTGDLSHGGPGGPSTSDVVYYSIVTLGVNFMTRILVDVFYVTLYWLDLDVLKKYKVNGQWMWESDPNYRGKIARSILHYLLLNVFIFIPLTVLTFDPVRDHDRISPLTVPTAWVSFKQIMIGLIIYDFLFYWIHRALHHRKLYWIHKMHHEYTNTVIWADAHTSVLEVLLVAVLPNIIIGGLISMHLYTQCMFIIVSITLGISQHSNYDLPYSPFYLIPLCNTYAGHVLHHRLTKVNYAPYWTFWDSVCGTAWVPRD